MELSQERSSEKLITPGTAKISPRESELVNLENIDAIKELEESSGLPGIIISRQSMFNSINDGTKSKLSDRSNSV